MAFYGAIEQVLTGWIFDVLPGAPADFEQAKAFVVETICGGLEPARRRPDAARRDGLGSFAMQNDLVKRLMWMGFVAGLESLASIAAIRPSAMAWRRMFGEDPRGSRHEHAAQETTDGATGALPPAGRRRRGRKAGDRDASRDPRRRGVRRRACARQAAGACPWPLSRPRRRLENETRARARRSSASPRARRRSSATRSSSPARGPAEDQDARPRRRGRRCGGRVPGGRRAADPARLRLAVLVPAVPRRAVLLGLLHGGRAADRDGGGRRMARGARVQEGAAARARRRDRRAARDAGHRQQGDDADEGPGPRGRDEAGGPARDERSASAYPVSSAPRSRPTAASSRARS